MATNIAIFPLHVGLQFRPRRQLNFSLVVCHDLVVWPIQGQLSGPQTPPIYCTLIVLLRPKKHKLLFDQIHQQNCLCWDPVWHFSPFFWEVHFSLTWRQPFWNIQEVDRILGFILGNQLTPALDHR
jgi:hypothetical protein